mmetsp:Transcript_19199/g.51578  ORF Transcript_19199/g.51578 Transcript_19199/m.51578 type:complete len:225 (-) Transcript_19199:12-686(-)
MYASSLTLSSVSTVGTASSSRGPVYFHTNILQCSLSSGTESFGSSSPGGGVDSCQAALLALVAPHRHSESPARSLCIRPERSRPLERQNMKQSAADCCFCMGSRKKGIPLRQGSSELLRLAALTHDVSWKFCWSSVSPAARGKQPTSWRSTLTWPSCGLWLTVALAWSSAESRAQTGATPAAEAAPREAKIRAEARGIANCAAWQQVVRGRAKNVVNSFSLEQT